MPLPTRRIQSSLPAVYALGALVGGTLGLWLFHATGSWGLGMLLVGTTAGSAGVVAHRVVSQRAEGLARLEAALAGLSRGETGARLEPDRMGELADTAAAVNRVMDVLDQTRGHLGDVARRLVTLPEQLAEALATVERSASDQEGAVEETAALHVHIGTSVRRIGGEVDKLARSNDESASSILQLGSAIEQVARSSATLQETVESSTSALHQVGDNIKRVAESSNSVQAVAEETAASVIQMDRSIQEVGVNVRGALELTEQVSASAEDGSEAVKATIDGIEEIREVTRTARAAIEGLAERIAEIGEIATVIGAITDETNLLSLNAAIIAAQAGEHGKAFAVVADQVKTLARRTSQSTKEIEELIGAIQDQSRRAVESVAAGIDTVEQGVSRSRVAGERLAAIRTSAADASQRVAEISRAAEEQERNSKLVAEAARRTSEHVNEITTAMAEQGGATEQLLENVTRAVQMCRQMTSATAEQKSSAQYITANTESITELIRSIQGATHEQDRATAAASQSVEALLHNARESVARLPQLGRAITELRDHAAVLGGVVARFGEGEAAAPDEAQAAPEA